MTHYIIEPEVAGGWGENTVFTRIPGTRTIIQKFHYELDGWLGDELLASSGNYIVTERAAESIINARLTGVKFDVVEVTTSDEFHDFEEINQNRKLPRFVWLKVVGRPGIEDFGDTGASQLVVSERALDILRAVGVSHASIAPWSDPHR